MSLLHDNGWVCRVHGITREPCPCNNVPGYQHYWCCSHHPSAMENFWADRFECEWGCHTQELKWYHNGKHPMPNSWGESAHDPKRKDNQHQR